MVAENGWDIPRSFYAKQRQKPKIKDFCLLENISILAGSHILSCQ